MTPEQQRIKIAEACGLTKYGPLVRMTRKGNIAPDGVRICYHVASKGGWTEYEDIPNYPEDLNAMHEAEKTICGADFDTDEWKLYLVNLDRVINKRRAHATAAQRAEAFLKTLGLWEE